MTSFRSLPGDLTRLQSKLGDPRRHFSTQRPEEKGCPPGSRQCSELAKRGVFDSAGNLGVEGTNPVEQHSSNSTPPHDVVTPDDHQPLSRDSHFPGGERAHPAAYVEVGNGTEPSMVGQLGESHPGEPVSGGTFESSDLPWGEQRGVLSREVFLPKNQCLNHAGPPRSHP